MKMAGNLYRKILKAIDDTENHEFRNEAKDRFISWSKMNGLEEGGLMDEVKRIEKVRK